MRRLRFVTAGESHGKGLVAILEGLPHGFAPDLSGVDRALARRQGGYGRSARQAIEADRVEPLAGLKRGKTIGAPLALWIGNKDARIDSYREIRRPRPGHADFAGAAKFEIDDVSDVMERASARETAARVAAGAVAAQVLSAVGIDVFSFVDAIGGVAYPTRAFESPERRREVRDASPFYALDPATDAAAATAVDAAKAAGDSVGGTFRVEIGGVLAGLGSCEQWDRRLDGLFGQALLSIPAIRAVAIGEGFGAASVKGTAFHDPFVVDARKRVVRTSNRAGGIEGGMTNGETVVVSAVMKPIPSVVASLPSVDLTTGEPVAAAYERSDVCAVPAASVAGEAMAALVMADALLEAVGDVPWTRFLSAVEALRARRRRL